MSEAYRYVLVPGRHHVLTEFQARYLRDLLGGTRRDTDGEPLDVAPDATLIWAVTSANHQNTRRNPIPLIWRAQAIARFAERERMRSLVIPVNDVPATDRFAAITLKTVTNATGQRIALTPENTVVAVSTPVMAMYRRLGFRVAPLEHGHPEAPPLSWEVLMRLAEGDRAGWEQHAHVATREVFDDYNLEELVHVVMADPLVGSEGGLTETRNYRTYAAAFENAGQRKWDQVKEYIRPGRIVDIGCATGGMLERAAADPRLAESDLYGIEVARALYEIAQHKLSEGAFANPNTWFYQRNILSGAIFPDASVDTTLTFALTHEIYSYGNGRNDLVKMARTIIEHTVPDGVWINSDVCGPAEPDRIVMLRFNEGSVGTEPRDLTAMSGGDVAAYLDAMPPASRFAQFAQDFRRNAGTEFAYDVVDDRTVRLTLRDAMEFMEHYRYTDNWLSETHERFCAMTWNDWATLMTEQGFEIDTRSGPWRNQWLVDNTMEPVATLSDPSGERIEWPDTHLLLVANRPPARDLG